MMSVTLISVALVLVYDWRRSRENCARRWLLTRGLIPEVSEIDPVSVETVSSPLSEIES